VVYQVSDEADVELRQTVHTTITPTVTPPVVSAVDDISSGNWDTNQTISPLANDPHNENFDLVNSSLKLCGISPVQTPNNCSQTTLVVPNEGTYTVNADGTVTFDPLPSFTGPATPIKYQVADSLDRVVNATITVTVGPPPVPTAVPDANTEDWDENHTFSPLANDTHDPNFDLVNSTLTLCAIDDPNAAGDQSETPPNCSLTTLVVPGQGTYTVDPTTGVVTFDPLPTFTGTATPVTYQAKDSLDRVVSSTITPTVGPPPAPAAEPVTSTGLQDANQVFDPTVNDTAGSTQFPLDQTTVKFCGVDDPATTTVDESQPPHCTATTLIVPGEGTYTVDPDTGVVTFDPEPDFVGTATPITYQISDTYGNTASSTITPTVVGRPTAVDDATSGPFNQPQSDSVLSDDSAATGATLEPSSLTLMDGSTPVTSVTATSGGVTQGVYTLGPDNTIIFTPEPGFVGTATPVTYRVTDSLGQTATATYTPTIDPPALPVMAPDTSSGPYQTAQTKDVLDNDTLPTGVTWEPNSLTLVGAAADGSVTALASDGTVQGIYTVVNDEIVFTPANGFVGTATPVTYEAEDSLGRVGSSTYTPTVTPPPPPVAVDDTSSGFINVAQRDDVVSDDISSTGVPISSSTIKLLDPATGQYGTSPVTTPEGTYSIVDGKVQFQPVTDFVGVATPVTYQITDSVGQTASATYTPTVIGPPDALDDTPAAGPFNTVQNIPILANDLVSSDTKAPFVVTSVEFLNPDGSYTKLLTTADGTYVANSDGTVTFTPRDGFIGVVTEPVTYRVADEDGQLVTAVITPSVVGPPAAVDDATSGPFNQPQSEDVLANDGAANGATLVPGTLRLVSVGEFGALTLGETVTVEDGVYTIDENGHITFTPNEGFVGTADPVTYQVKDSLGQTVTATYTPTVDPPAAPVVLPDTSSGPYQAPQTQDVLANDVVPDGVTWKPETLMLVGAAADGSVTVTGDKTAPDGTVTTGTQGVYTVVAGKIVFTPEPDFVGTATPVTYQVTDSLNRTVSTTYTPTVDPIPVPRATPDRTIGPLDQPQSFFVLTNDDPGPGARIDGTYLRLWDPVAEEWTDDTVEKPEGTYTIRTVGNPTIEIVFTPVPGFVGVATPVTYQMANNFGQFATTTYTPEIRTDPPPGPAAQLVELVQVSLARTGLGPLGGAGLLVAGLLGVGALALSASRRSQKARATHPTS
jgi:CshA-type fibril repeat protein